MSGFHFNVDASTRPPVCCPKPQFGPHEAQIITHLTGAMVTNAILEIDDGPYATLNVLAAKPNQERKHWTEYIWRLCVSYQPINVITQPFALTIKGEPLWTLPLNVISMK